MSSLSLLIVHNDDSKQWIDYIVRVIQQRHADLRYQTMLDSSLQAAKLTQTTSQVVIVVLSPGHLDFLLNSTALRYTDCPCGLIFLCGVAVDELQTPCPRISGGRALMREHFANYSQWLRLTHDAKQTELRNTVDKIVEMASRKIEPKTTTTTAPAPRPKSITVSNAARLLQPTARSDESSIITIAFEKPVATDSKVEVSLSDDMVSAGDPIKTERINPQTFTFEAPEHQEGKVKVSVLIDSKAAARDLELVYVSPSGTVQDVSQIYLNLMDIMCQMIQQQLPAKQRSSVALGELDEKLSSLFDIENSSADVPARAFEQLFGLYRFDSSEEKDSELPTLIHFAAKYGLKELCSKLTDLPDAPSALTISNRSRKTPQDLASHNGHSELASFLQNYIELDRELESVYAVYYNQKGDMGRYVNAAPFKMTQESHYMPMTGWKNRGDAGYVKASRSEVPEDEYYVECIGDEIPANPAPSSSRSSQVSSPHNSFKGQTNPRPPSKPAPAIPNKPAAAPTAAGGKPDTNMPTDQVELVEINNKVKAGTITLQEAEQLFRQWQNKYQGTSAKSFKEKQERLKKLQEHVQIAREESAKKGSAQPSRTGGGSSRQPAPPPSGGIFRNSNTSVHNRDSGSGASISSGMDFDQYEDDTVDVPPIPPRRPLAKSASTLGRR